MIYARHELALQKIKPEHRIIIDQIIRRLPEPLTEVQKASLEVFLEFMVRP